MKAKIANTPNTHIKYKPVRFDFFRKRRELFYVFLTIFLFGIPFIKINGNQIFLLSFEHSELHLIGFSFSVQELYLMPFLLIILFVGIFFMTSLGGRVWCGWGCPQTIFRLIFRDIIQTKLLKLRKRVEDKQKKPDLKQFDNKIKYYISLCLMFLITLFASANLLFFFTPPNDFFEYILNPTDHKILLTFWIIIALILFADIVFLAENFCIYMCPYARVQSVLYDNDTIMPIYDVARGGAVFKPNGQIIGIPPKKIDSKNECVDCLKCVKVCPTHIDIRKGGMQLECINCLECVDACTTTMATLGKKSLISWISPNALNSKTKIRFFRIKTVSYIILMVIVFVILLFIASTKDTMLLNINRTSELYEIRNSGVVDNSYKFLMENTDSNDHIFSFEILDNMNEKIEIVLPEKKEILIRANDSRIFVVLLRAKTSLNDLKSDIKIPIKIRAYAVDNDKIFISKDTVFIYPGKDSIGKLKKS